MTVQHPFFFFHRALVQLCDRCILGRSHRTATESHLYPAGSLGFLKDSGGPCSFDGVGALGSPRTLQRLPRSADLPPDGRAHPLPVSDVASPRDQMPCGRPEVPQRGGCQPGGSAPLRRELSRAVACEACTCRLVPCWRTETDLRVVSSHCPVPRNDL
ncbi:uncharacterized protein LOC143664822 isoform X2 [Tamandua tetradactyla]|uniref:uncharacterized protein LOC143664822 isoform X2 n=1 Tax=Tamandua tetradactyla TaxID=48850 RepID=UPI00405428DF